MSHPSPTDVSVIIPFHNRADLTCACLDSLALNTADVSFEVILVDDASTEALDPARWHGRLDLRVIRNDARRSFSENNNAAAAQARGKYLCLLNNDTEVDPNWLRPLVDVLDRDPVIGVLGNKHLFPGKRTLHHAGMAFDDRDYPLHIHPGTDPSLPAVNFQRDVPCVTFACVLIPANVYRQLGGLDTGFRNGFEDCDFCLRARDAGFRIAYTPASSILHHGQATANRVDHDDANWRRFQEKWTGRTGRQLEEWTRKDRELNVAAKRRPRLRPVHPPGLHLHLQAGEPSAFTWAGVDLALALAARGEPVSVSYAPFIHKSIPPAKSRALRRLMHSSPCGDFHVKWSHYWPQYLKCEPTGDINAELFCTNYRYRPEGRWLDLWMRHVQANESRKLPVSEFNRQALLEIGIAARDCAVVPLGYSPEIDQLGETLDRLRAEERDDLHILLVTNSHDLNRYGTDIAVSALSEAFGPDDPVIVHVKDYGGGGDAVRNLIGAQRRFPRTEWHLDFVSKEALLELYAKMDVQLAPFRGEGFAMKILDGMAIGLPALFPAFGGPTEFAVPGTFVSLPYDEVEVGPSYDRDTFYIGEGAYWCGVRVPVLAGILKSLPSRRAELEEMGRAARLHVRGRFSWDASAGALMRALRGWGADRMGVVAQRRAPSTKPITVIIPTQDREAVLEKTLIGYTDQSLPAADFEVLVVNDHGRRPELDAVLQKYAPRLEIRCLENEGPVGPASARNLAIEHARGDIVLITGDDIIPGKDFLNEHLAAHKKYPELETGFVGLTLWHKELQETPFMQYITGEGGHQFSYKGLKDGQLAGFARLYTSNCSLKRALLAEEERLFSVKYRYAAFEDTEFGYRLSLRGMQLRFAERAKGYHLHAMTPSTFAERQRRVGRMLTLLCLQHPSFVPPSHTAFLRALEYFRSSSRHGDLASAFADTNPDRIVDELVKGYELQLRVGDHLSAPEDRAIVNAEREAWKKWVVEAGHQSWESASELILRLGMVEEWCVKEELLGPAKAWMYAIALPKVLGHSNRKLHMPFSVPDWFQSLFPDSRLAYYASLFLRRAPLVGRAVQAVERSHVGQYARAAAMRCLLKKNR